MIDWSKLEDVYRLAGKAQVSFSLVYEESCDEWYFEISSAAPSENYVGRGTLYSLAIEDVIAHLKSICA